MNRSQQNKSIAFLLTSLCLMAAGCLSALTGFGQSRGDRWLDTRLRAIDQLQEMRESFKDTLLANQRYLITGDRLQFQSFAESADNLKQHLFTLKALDNGNYGNSEQVREVANQLGLILDELSLDAQLRQEKGAGSARQLLLTTRELRDAARLSRVLLALEQDEAQAVRGYYSGDVKARGNSLPLIFLLLATFAGVYGVFLLRGNEDSNLDSGSVSGSSSESSDLGSAGQTPTSALESLKAELKLAHEQLDRLANVDFLTEVSNVRGLEQVLKAEDNRVGRTGGHLIAMLINCDDFHKINDAFGHSTGDIVLKEVAKRIKGTLRPSDHVARVGGDEFLVLLPDTQLAYGMRVAERIRVAIADTPLRGAQDVVHVSASLGLANLPLRIASVNEVVTLSRTALKRSKAGGKNKVSLARDHGIEKAEDDQPTPKSIVAQLCDSTQFRTVYQPIMDLNSEKIAGYEVLTRGPDGSFESPADFFRICIENNILTTVDLQCLQLCLEDAPNVGHNMRLHVNLFPSTLLETPVENLIKLFPQERNGTTYCLEISEQQFITEPGYLREAINALKQAGILVAIDDVGFGRSSLETLILLEPDLVKVDRKYVSGISVEPSKARLLRRLANVAKSLGAEIVAEGIEDRNDLPLLKEMGINYGQGFLWGDLLAVLPVSTDGDKS
ncbi:MAG: EAL domain-containing protein [Candidatus Melainabacteria bacterium]|nr:EAL domain-containing protein [Candidatus Melainabacteria bacterium]